MNSTLISWTHLLVNIGQHGKKLARIKRTRLAKECAKLDPTFEKAIADEGLTEDLRQWPEY
jgi:hypothetical protein